MIEVSVKTHTFCPSDDKFCYKEARNAGEFIKFFIHFNSHLHGFLIINKAGVQEAMINLGFCSDNCPAISVTMVNLDIRKAAFHKQRLGF